MRAEYFCQLVLRFDKLGCVMWRCAQSSFQQLTIPQNPPPPFCLWFNQVWHRE